MLFFKITGVALAILAVITLFRPALSEYKSNITKFNENDLLVASKITKEDARYHYILGLYYFNNPNRPDIDKAIKSYLLSLEKNPLDSNSWLAIARAYRDKGMKEYAGYAVKKAVYADRNNPDIIWESGVFLLESNVPEAISLLRKYIYMVPQEQENVYSLSYMMGVEPAYMLKNLIPQEYSFYQRYLNFLMNNKLFQESAEAWRAMKTFNPERKDYIQYCNFLIQSGNMSEASEVWNEFLKRFDLVKNGNTPNGNHIWNGGFEMEIENGGFDWVIGTTEGVRIFRDRDIKASGYASLSARFDGKNNPDVYIAQQIVLIEPGKLYKVAGSIKTDKITTRNGIFLEVSGYQCSPFVIKAEPVTGTNLWKRMELEFTTPQNCKAVRVGIRREKSDKFDNKIGGDVWIDSISMIQKTY